MKWLRRVLISLGIAYLAILALIFTMQDRLIFPGWAGPSAQAVATTPGLTECSLPHPDGTPRRGWQREADANQPTVVLFHGNAGTQWRRVQELAMRGYGLILVPYSGFAGNPGAPSESAIRDDAKAVMAYVAAQGLRPQDVILYGESLGTGIAADIAALGGNWRAVVLDTPYTSIADRAAEIYWYLPVRLLIRHDFDTEAIIDQITAPILIAHGTDDEVIPYAHGRALFDQANEPKAGVWIDGGRHQLPPDQVLDALEGLLARTAP